LIDLMHAIEVWQMNHQDTSRIGGMAQIDVQSVWRIDERQVCGMIVREVALVSRTSGRLGTRCVDVWSIATVRGRSVPFLGFAQRSRQAGHFPLTTLNGWGVR